MNTMDLDGTLEQTAEVVREEEKGSNIALKTRTYHPSYPIDNYEGDLVLLSKDDVLFRVHSFILRMSSSFFRQMLDIPRSTSESARDPNPMEENAAIVAIMLDVMYPNSILREEATRRNVEMYAEELIAAADKYDMRAVTATVSSVLFSAPGKAPSLNDRWSAIRLYDLARNYGLENERRIASGWTLHYCLTSPDAISEMRRFSADTTLHLQELHRRRIHSYMVSLVSIANARPCRVQVSSLNNTQNIYCAFANSDAWRFFAYEVAEALTKDPLGSRLLKNETWDEGGYAQIFGIFHNSSCGLKTSLRIPSKSIFIMHAQDALKKLHTFI